MQPSGKCLLEIDLNVFYKKKLIKIAEVRPCRLSVHLFIRLSVRLSHLPRPYACQSKLTH